MCFPQVISYARSRETQRLSYRIAFPDLSNSLTLLTNVKSQPASQLRAFAHLKSSPLYLANSAGLANSLFAQMLVQDTAEHEPCVPMKSAEKTHPLDCSNGRRCTASLLLERLVLWRAAAQI